MHVVSVNFLFTQQMCNRWFSPVYQSYRNFQLDSVQLQTDCLIAVKLLPWCTKVTLNIAQTANSCRPGPRLQSSHCEGSRFTAHDPVNFGCAKVCNHCSPKCDCVVKVDLRCWFCRGEAIKKNNLRINVGSVSWTLGLRKKMCSL